MSLRVPASSLNIHTVAKTSIFWFFSDRLRCLLIINLELITELINGNDVFSGIILQRSREESLGEEESRDPESGWRSAIDPLLQEVDSISQIDDPRGERFQTQEADGGRPCNWNLIIEQGI